MSRKKIFIDAILAGLFISIGCIAFLLSESKIIGALLFVVGLFTICTFNLNLFTGKICYIVNNDSDYAINVSIIWFGNIVGTYATSLLLHFTKLYPTLKDKATLLVDGKLNDSLLSIFILAFFCNILIYLAVEEFKNNPHEIGKYLGLFFGVIVFIMCGFEHCVANMFYFSICDAWSFKSLIYILVMTFGNGLGGILIPLIKKKIDK